MAYGHGATRADLLNAAFAAELTDRVRTLNQLLLRLERRDADDSPLEEALGELARELHNLKGAARAAGAGEAEQLAHAAEAAVAEAMRAGRQPEAAWFEILYRCADAFDDAYRGTAGVELHELHELQRSLRGKSASAEVAAAASAEVVAAAAVADEELKLIPPPAHGRGPGGGHSLPAPAPGGGHSSHAGGSSSTGTESVRVAVTKLDALLAQSGELAVTQLRVAQRLGELRDVQRQIERWQRDWRKNRSLRASLARRVGQADDRPQRDVEALARAFERAERDMQSIAQGLAAATANLAQNTAQLANVSSVLGQEVMGARLLPVGTIFSPFERLVRDLARSTAKEVDLCLAGSETEIDRKILEQLRDPLMHMVRNAVDHGIESPEARQTSGKSPRGRITLSAAQRGDTVQIVIEDDGRGLDAAGIRQVAVERGLVSPERAESLDDASAVNLIFSPGFSTRSVVTEISGRGVGMDVVREQSTRLGGDVRVRSILGQGTSFTITVPLTLATTRVLLVEQDGRTFAIPSSTIERTGRLRASDLLLLEGRQAVKIDGGIVPVVELGDVLSLPPRPAESAGDWRPFFVLRQNDRPIALLTSRLVDEQEIVVKSLGAPLRRVRNVAGAAVLGTGQAVVILNPSDLARTALGRIEGSAASPARQATVAAPGIVRRRVLVVDDSVMTRTLERSILEAGGYEVVVATDGAHALDVLRLETVDLVVSDVEMPRLSGFELTAALRQDDRWRHLPVVLVTSLDSPEHLERGASVGADAYIVKGRFDQGDLLQTVGRLL